MGADTFGILARCIGTPKEDSRDENEKVADKAGEGEYQMRVMVDGLETESENILSLKDEANASEAAEAAALTNAPGSLMPRFFHLDHLGSTRLITDTLGNVLSSHDYYPFGAERLTAGPQDETNSFLFAYAERDRETALDYLQERYSSPAMGRFMSPDPLAGSMADPQSWNRYAYVRNNPLNWTDPTGMQGVLISHHGSSSSSGAISMTAEELTLWMSDTPNKDAMFTVEGDWAAQRAAELRGGSGGSSSTGSTGTDAGSEEGDASGTDTDPGTVETTSFETHCGSFIGYDPFIQYMERLGAVQNLSSELSQRGGGEFWGYFQQEGTSFTEVTKPQYQAPNTPSGDTISLMPAPRAPWNVNYHMHSPTRNTLSPHDAANHARFANDPSKTFYTFMSNVIVRVRGGEYACYPTDPRIRSGLAP